MTRDVEELTSVYAKFIKEKGDLEREYAESIRKLVVRYQDRKQAKQGINTSKSIQVNGDLK